MSQGISQNLISSIKTFPQHLAHERFYQATYAVATVALTAFSYYATFTFFLAALPLACANAFYFTRAVKEWDSSQHNQLKNWMVITSIVTSVFFASAALRSAPLIFTAARSLASLDMSWALLSLTTLTGMLGYGGEAARSLYYRGQELAQQETWKPMQDLMKNPRRTEVSSIWNRFCLYVGITAPHRYTHLLAKLTASTQTADLVNSFLPSEARFETFKSNLSYFQAIQSVAAEEADAMKPLLQSNYLNLTSEHQCEMAPTVIALNLFTLDQLPDDVRQDYLRKKDEAGEKLGQLPTWQREKEALFSKIRTAPDDQIDGLARGFSELRQQVADLTALCRQFGLSDRRTNSLAELHNELMTHPSILELQQRVSTLRAKESEALDREDMTWNYFLVQLDPVDRTCSRAKELMVTFQRKLELPIDTNYASLDEKLNGLGIGTIGEFLDKVLLGDTEALKDTAAINQKLDEFLAAKTDTRSQIYSYLGGVAKVQASSALDLVGRVAFRSVMIFTAVAPIISYPYLTAMGATTAVVYSIPPVTRWVDQSDFLQIATLRYRWLMQIATRRPFFSLLTGNFTHETVPYLSADLLGKLRILAAELFFGSALHNASLDRNGQLRGVGAAVQGFAIGREFIALTNRAYRRITS